MSIILNKYSQKYRCVFLMEINFSIGEYQGDFPDHTIYLGFDGLAYVIYAFTDKTNSTILNSWYAHNLTPFKDQLRGRVSKIGCVVNKAYKYLSENKIIFCNSYRDFLNRNFIINNRFGL